jgi:hypothetical protein
LSQLRPRIRPLFIQQPDLHNRRHSEGKVFFLSSVIRSSLAYSYLCTYDLYSPVHNVLDACISITRAGGRELGLEIESFLGPVKWHRADSRVPFRALKTCGGWGSTKELNRLARAAPPPPLTKLIRNQKETVRHIICATGA